MTTEPEIVELPERPYVAIAASVTMRALGTVVPPLNREVFGWLAARGAPPSGPPFWRYNLIDMDRELEVEAGTTVAAPVPGDDRVRAGVLPAGRYATVRHVGHPETLSAATAALLDWAAAKGLKWDVSPSPEGERWGCRLEIHHSDPVSEPDMTKWVTELAFRLEDEDVR
ncbi:MAG: GyrI-like domain-containing protein [Streptosporangiaceae bacterium]|nr:GyrI-like domain-containing protein [Streptosporangiaceae bacterium]